MRLLILVLVLVGLAVVTGYGIGDATGDLFELVRWLSNLRGGA